MNSLLLLIAFSVQPTVSDRCMEYSTIAEIIMTRRQEGYTIEDMKSKISKEMAITDEGKIVITIIDSAYNTQVFQHITEKLEVVRIFGDKIFIQCLQDNTKES